MMGRKSFPPQSLQIQIPKIVLMPGESRPDPLIIAVEKVDIIRNLDGLLPS